MNIDNANSPDTADKRMLSRREALHIGAIGAAGLAALGARALFMEPKKKITSSQVGDMAILSEQEDVYDIDPEAEEGLMPIDRRNPPRDIQCAGLAELVYINWVLPLRSRDFDTNKRKNIERVLLYNSDIVNDLWTEYADRVEKERWKKENCIVDTEGVSHPQFFRNVSTEFKKKTLFELIQKYDLPRIVKEEQETMEQENTEQKTGIGVPLYRSL